MKNRFVIGQHGAFDRKKDERDFRDGFWGVEACLFGSEEDTRQLLQESERRGFRIGVHFPFRSGLSKLRDAPVVAQEDAIRQEAYEIIQQELDYLTRIKPDYILFHYPKPVILDDRVDWNRWRFADPLEYVYESQYSYEELARNTEQLFQWLCEKSETYRFVPVLEFDALNRYVYETGFLTELLQKYPRIRLCLDTGRLYLQERLDPFFDAKNVLRTYARFAYTVHLWNVRVGDNVTHNHYPALPELDPADGWAPIEEYLTIIMEENDRVNIVFEHRSDLISDEQLEQCYAWVEEIMKRRGGGYD
jgi:hypothetical protein